MQLFLITTAIFVLAMLGVSIGTLAGRQQRQCGCKEAARIMKQKENAACASCASGTKQPLIEIDEL
jgi:hypothetical protein